MTENNFTHSTQMVLMHAFSIARKLSHNHISSEHLLLGIFKEPCGIAGKILAEYDLTEDALMKSVCESLGKSISPSQCSVSLSDEAAAIIEGAAVLAQSQRTTQIYPEHLLLSILDNPNCGGAVILEGYGINAENIRNKVSGFVPRKNPVVKPPVQSPKSVASPQKKELKLTLMYGVDMTQKALDGEYDPVTGRAKEVSRLIQVLSRRQKSNPVLLGNAGVGKTAIVESLASIITQAEPPSALAGKRLVSLDVAQLISGTKYRGEFEERVRNIIDEVKNAKNIILFIDELHMISGAGAAEGAIDAANILKPALSRSQIQVIGASTPAEYKKYIRKDSALARRFQPIEVSEPSPAEAKRILLHLSASYGEHHNVKILPSAVEAAVDLSARYITDRYLPDKAIDLLDEAASYAFLHRCSAVTEEHIRIILSQMTGISSQNIGAAERQRLRNLKEELSKHMVGQQTAVDAVCRAVRRTRAFGSRGRPGGSLLFCGPSGVGKTQLARALARTMFDSPDNMIRIDMSEYMEKHSVSKLIGSPPGYVGYGEGGQLTEKVRRMPYSVILFDEVEKAHADVLNLLLQILDEGFLTDSEGEKVNFQCSIVIMTSNLGLDKVSNMKKTGFLDHGDVDFKGDIMKEIKKTFRPELLNRLDDVIVFSPLTVAELQEIAQRELCLLKEKLLESSITLSWMEDAKTALVKEGSDPLLGARPIKRRISSLIEDEIAEMWISGDLESKALVSVESGKIKICAQ